MSNTGALYLTEVSQSLRGKRVLITGASGFVGGHIARQALTAGLDLHLLVRRPLAIAGARQWTADLDQRDATRSAILAAEPDIVINLAAPGVAHGTADFQTMVTTLALGAEALLSACAELKSPPHFIHVGTGFEYAHQDRPIREDDPIMPAATPYGAAKAASSAVVGGFSGDLPITLLRPFNIYGAGDSAPRLGQYLIRSAAAGSPLRVTAGEQVRDFLHVDDFGTLVWSLAASSPAAAALRVFNVGSGQPRTLRDYILAIVAGLHERGHNPVVEFGAIPYREGEPMSAIPDLAGLFAVSDWRPGVPFAAGVADYVDWELSRCP